MKFLSFFILIAFTSALTLENLVPVSESGCAIEVGQDQSPLIIQTGQNQFIYPKTGKTTRIIDIPSGESVDMVCPGKTVDVDTVSYDSFVTATCVSGSILKINGKNVEWRKIYCSSRAVKTARLTGNACENNGKELEIGFDVKDRFLRIVLICFDESKQEALYSHANITASINQRIDDIPRPDWVEGAGIYNISSVNTYYIRNHQRNTINAALGLPAESTKYIQDNDYFLSRGHMTAKGDNFYPAQQNATFFLLNVAPQWQTCNARNWNQVEIYVRDYAESHNVDLLEWTGVYGVTTLPHEETGEAVKLYLYNQNGQQLLPVPEIYWKVAYEPISQKGIAIIVINNPYLSTYQPICEDISGSVEWLKWHKNSQKKGFGYACTVNSFRKNVTYLPQFTVKDILL